MNEQQQVTYDKFVQFVMNNLEWKSWQNQMVIEESLEFSLAILHMLRGKSKREDLVSEIAGLENMMGQIRAMHGITGEEVVTERIRKIERAMEKHGIVL